MKILTIFLCAALLIGCSAAQKLRRAEKLIAKAELQGAKWRIDTVFTERVINVPGPETTVKVPVTVLKDTTIVQEKIVTVIRWIKGKDGKTDTLTVFTKCPDQVIRDTVATVINKSIVAPKSPNVKPWWRTAALVGWGLWVLVIAFVIVLRVAKTVVP